MIESFSVDMGILLNIFVILLLFVTIGYAYNLNKKIKDFQSQALHIENLTNQFVTATQQAEIATQNLKQQGAELSGKLDKSINKGERLYADIDFLLCRAEKVALTMDKGIQKPITTQQAVKTPDIQKTSIQQPASTKSQAEQELLAAIASAKQKMG